MSAAEQKRDALKAVSAVSNVLATNSQLWPEDERVLSSALSILNKLTK